MKGITGLIVAVLVAPLIGLAGFVVYDRHKQAKLSEYHTAKSLYILTRTDDDASVRQNAYQRLQELAKATGMPGPSGVDAGE